MHPTPGSVFDREFALTRVGGDPQLLKEIAVLFLEHYPQWTGALHAAALRGDANALERAAHELKGSVANFGAGAAVEAALRLERLGRSRDFEGAMPAIQALELALAALRPELESL
ncbi:MAG TPA: Hpt domain-containing protein [Bryobacteraceae bacterium]|nr:Hpt domain-containing protein [Bryobacteraceae bacterium]